MTKLTETQKNILIVASHHEDRIATLPATLRGGAAAKVVNAMIAKGLLQEVDADMHKGDPVWRSTGDGHGTTLIATDAGINALGLPVTKQAVLIDLLKRPQGATIDEMVEATGWQKHTIRGAMSGALKKRLGLTITSDKEERGRVYRIA
jgi:hypothetical protein